LPYGNGNNAAEERWKAVAMRTQGEWDAIQGIADRLTRLQEFLNNNACPDAGATADDWFTFLASFKAILGNSSSDLGLVSCLMAKDYLSSRFQLVPIESQEAAEGKRIDSTAHGHWRTIIASQDTSPTEGAIRCCPNHAYARFRLTPANDDSPSTCS